MMDFKERRAWNFSDLLVLIGPGGAGKSSLGHELAPLLGRYFIDLDTEFRRRLGDISAYIRDEGYERYKLANSKLAASIAANVATPTLLVTSSGFLTSDNPPLALEANQSLVASGYALCLLPSAELELGIHIIVERQMIRPFARSRAREEMTIRERYPVYAALGDLIVFSAAAPELIARQVAEHLSTA